MEIDFFELFQNNSTLMLFTVVWMGLLLGRARFGSIELGSTTGVLLIALVFGHFGFKAEAILGTFGFTMFIFAVGLQAGPTFFSAFMTDGKKYIALAVIVAVSSLGLALAIGRFIGLDYGMNAGLLAGALTSTPTLAGAQDALTSGVARLPEGMTAAQANENIGVAYAITYIFGTIGLILFIRYLPVILRIDLPAEARRLAKERGFGHKEVLAHGAEDIPLIRAYRLPEEVEGKSIAEIQATRGRRGVPLSIRRGGKIIDVDVEDTLQKGDVISVIGSMADHEKNKEVLGQEMFDAELLNFNVVTKEVIVIRNTIVGKSLADLNIPGRYGCFVRGLKRASISLPTHPGVILNKGDRLYLTGEESRLNEVAEEIGRVEAEETDTDLLTFSVGIGIGVLVGMVMIKVGGVSIGLGSAGGLLLIGILLGFMRSVYPAFGGVPPAARKVMMEFGLVLFMAGVGLNAGAGIVDGFLSAGPKLIIGGILVTVCPVLVAYFVGRKFLKMNPAILLGSITGSMTSTPSLNVITDAAKNDIPALGYAGTYTFANVLLTFAGTVIMTI